MQQSTPQDPKGGGPACGTTGPNAILDHQHGVSPGVKANAATTKVKASTCESNNA